MLTKSVALLIVCSNFNTSVALRRYAAASAPSALDRAVKESKDTVRMSSILLFTPSGTSAHSSIATSSAMARTVLHGYVYAAGGCFAGAGR